jgi:1-acyl-sn-glycerol-3-phosphate acyltransferase
MPVVAEVLRGAVAQAWFFGGMPLVSAWLLATTRDGAGAREGYLRHAGRSLSLAGLDLELTGTEHLPEGGWVCTYNESSVADIMAYTACMYRTVDRAAAAGWYAWLPFVGPVCRRAGIGFVRPGRREANDRLLADMVEAARAGAHVGWGGEGALTGRDEVMRFKQGCALVAIRAGVPLVPLAIRGGQRLLPLGSLRARPGTVKLRIGEPLPTQGLTDTDARDLADRAQAAVASLHAAL